MTAPYVIVMWPSLGTEISQAIEPFYLPGLVFIAGQRVWRSWSSTPASGALGDARDTVEDLLRDADTATPCGVPVGSRRLRRRAGVRCRCALAEGRWPRPE